MKNVTMVLVAMLTAACGDNLDGPPDEPQRWCPVRDVDHCTALGGDWCVGPQCIVGEPLDLEAPYCINPILATPVETDHEIVIDGNWYELSSPLAACPDAVDM